MFQKLGLDRVQVFAGGDAFDGADFLAFSLGAQHQARADDGAIDRDRTSAAIAGAAALFGAGKAKTITKNVEDGFARVANKLRLVAVNGGGYVDHVFNLSRGRMRFWRRVSRARLRCGCGIRPCPACR